MIGDSQIVRMGAPDYTTFKVLAFDIYGTLIDWKGSILLASLPLLKEIEPNKIEANDIITLFRKHEREIQAEEPTLPYREVVKLAELRSRAEYLGKSEAEARLPENLEQMLDVGKWPAFWDSVEAVQRLKKYFKIVAYSNVDRQSFNATVAGALKGLVFDAAYIAEDIGCYKPDIKFLHHLISHAKQDFGAEKNEILMVAHGLEMNHVPVKEEGMKPGVWIMRGEGPGVGKEYEGKVELGAKFLTLKEFADTVEAAFEGKGKMQEVPKPHVPEVLKALEDMGLGGS